MASPAALRLLALSALLLLCAPTTSASLTPSQLVSNINSITAKGNALQVPATSINILSGALMIVGQGPFPQIITGFSQIVTELSTDIAVLDGTKPLKDSDTKAVADAVKELVRVHQVLLNTLIGKAGLFTEQPFVGAPIAAVLRSYEGVIDTFFFQVANVAESKSISADQNSLDITIATAIKAYSGPGHLVQ